MPSSSSRHPQTAGPHIRRCEALPNMSLGHRIVDGVNAAGFSQRPAHSAVMAHIDVKTGTRLTTIAAPTREHHPTGGRRAGRRP